MESTSTSFREVRDVVVDALGIHDRADTLTESTPLLGGMPEFDSLAVVEVITVIETRFGIDVDDLDLTGEVFETLGSLSSFVDEHRSV